MRPKIRSRLALPLLLLALAPAPGRAQPAANPERTAVQQTITQFAEHIQAGELDAIAAFFPARGVHILADDATTHGWPEYRDQHLTSEMPDHRGRYAHTAVEAVVRGNVAWVAFRRVFGPAEAEVQGRGTAVLEKVDDRWVIVHLHMSR